tara:strand:- start:105166 stop:106353 length:1188 start_codon:yes stop_codon:yes gene_type:complete
MTDEIHITCRVCNEGVHSIQLHLKEAHPDVSLQDYKETYPGEPTLSDFAKARIAAKSEPHVPAPAVLKTAMAPSASVSILPPAAASSKQPLHELFGFGEAKGARSSKGGNIPITVLNGTNFDDMVPEPDEGHVYDVELVKSILLGLELSIPVYLWGHAGVGKTSLYEDICAKTNRPMMRVQHTINTEEVHIVGQILANASGTYYEPGPLALAMRHGWVYNADEYDFAHPSVLAVYQAILEGKPLIIKEAPAEWRRVKPHPDFRFVASGNSNGSGDEFGLYPGVELGNSANYSRFGITAKVDYMPKEQEVAVLCNKAGIVAKDANKIVEFARSIRKAFEAQKMSSTIGPRELIYAARVGMLMGSWRKGISLAYINRLNETDREVADGMAQRIFSKS